MLGARHRKHGSGFSTQDFLCLRCIHLFRGSSSLRQRRTAKEVAHSSAEWGNPFGVCYDREVWYVSHLGSPGITFIWCMLVASSDATNIRTSIRQEGDEIVINGHKWFVRLPTFACFWCLNGRSYSRYISGAGDPRTKLHLVLGKSDPNNSNAHHQQSIVIVPADAPGVKVIRQMMVMGFDDAPEGHSEIIYDNVRVPLGNLVLGWGRGFEVGFTREYILGPCSLPRIDHPRASRTWTDTPLHEVDRCCPSGTRHHVTTGNGSIP